MSHVATTIAGKSLSHLRYTKFRSEVLVSRLMKIRNPESRKKSWTPMKPLLKAGV
jgi:hypothetical protein